NISLHSFEANDITIPFEQYLDECFQFGKDAEGKKIVVYRFWNQGGADQRNNEIFHRMKFHFPEPWKEGRRGTTSGQKLFWEFGEKFDWPDLDAPLMNPNIACYGLRDQLGILCDGTVVPCCLDHEGDIPLGNIFTQTLDEILSSPRSAAIYDGFMNCRAVEPLCQRCGYAQRFAKK
ncbi:MAG: SPASM domain-containing protein, partial [Firmicutes bacterium]|nr:SPASM domain-containing protein [Bacillota bacterium]